MPRGRYRLRSLSLQHIVQHIGHYLRPAFEVEMTAIGPAINGRGTYLVRPALQRGLADVRVLAPVDQCQADGQRASRTVLVTGDHPEICLHARQQYVVKFLGSHDLRGKPAEEPDRFGKRAPFQARGFHHPLSRQQGRGRAAGRNQVTQNRQAPEPTRYFERNYGAKTVAKEIDRLVVGRGDGFGGAIG